MTNTGGVWMKTRTKGRRWTRSREPLARRPLAMPDADSDDHPRNQALYSPHRARIRDPPPLAVTLLHAVIYRLTDPAPGVHEQSQRRIRSFAGSIYPAERS